jgi:signal transduction histidine kinase
MSRPDRQFSAISKEVLHITRSEARWTGFLNRVSQLLLERSGCDVVEVVLQEGARYRHCSAAKHQPLEPASIDRGGRGSSGARQPCPPGNLEQLCRDLLAGAILPAGRRFTPDGSFYTGAAERPVTLAATDGQSRRYRLGGYFRSIAMIPFDLQQGQTGLLVLKSAEPRLFGRRGVEFYESIAQLLGVTIVHRRIQIALRERVKELSCLYDIARAAGAADASLDDILQATVDLLPPAWLYPEIASARVELDGTVFRSPVPAASVAARLRADIVIERSRRGEVEIDYHGRRPTLDEGPFLREERNLIDAIARELALIVIQRSAVDERQRLQDQLRHADRLATIGQLSAGVAHELNEPLGSILGFAQLARKDLQIPDQVQRDLDKIINASLHAREVIGKLMLFARQAPPQKNWVNLNVLIQDGLYFLESRCAKSGIALQRELAPELPEVTADPGQLYQVLINLAVNAIQAMPDGGELTFRTVDGGDSVALVVEDTGVGMSEEVRAQVFLPFFTTKDVGEGTGLGLAVADGIVKSHDGQLSVESRPGAGARFTVTLPVSRPPPRGEAAEES